MLEEGQGRILEVEVPPSFPPTALSAMTRPADSIVGAILRGDAAIVPRGGDVVRGGDHLLIFCTADSAELVRDYFTSGVS